VSFLFELSNLICEEFADQISTDCDEFSADVNIQLENKVE